MIVLKRKENTTGLKAGTVHLKKNLIMIFLKIIIGYLSIQKVNNDKVDINFIDLFSGAGGISVGARNAGLNKIASIEIDKDASATIRNNFPESQHIESPIEKVELMS